VKSKDRLYESWNGSTGMEKKECSGIACWEGMEKKECSGIACWEGMEKKECSGIACWEGSHCIEY
jgi:hypothetical protein